MHFNVNSPFWRFMDTLVRFTELNLVYLLCCIPIVTIGTSSAALYSTLFQYDQHDDVPLVKEFFKRWKKEFKQSFPSWLIFLVLIAAVIFAITFWSQLPMKTGLSYIVLAMMVIFCVFLATTLEWFFAIEARYSNKFWRTFQIAFQMPWMTSAILYTLALLAIDIAFATLAVFTHVIRIIAIFFGIAWIFYAKSLLMLHCFDRIDHPNKDHSFPSVRAVS
jgi:uncharacterized membrane protein YesL